MATDLSIDDRREKEVQLLSGKVFMPLIEIAQTIGVSDSTVRRDLEILEEQGIVRRTHGGAILLTGPASRRWIGGGPDAPAAAEKQAIARAVAELIPPGQTLMLNGGRTCHRVAEALRGRRLNVVTNSATIGSLLCRDLATEVTLVGGYVYPRIGVTVGATAEEQIETLHATQLVTSCAGLTADGAFESNQMMVDVERRMMHSADEVILAIDHTKLGMRSVVKLADLNELDVIVTDAGADPQARQWLAALDPKVIYAAAEPAPQPAGA